MKNIILLSFTLFVVAAFGQKFTPRGSFDYFPSGYNTKYAISQPNDAWLVVKRGTFRVRIGADYSFGKNLSAYFDQATYMDWSGRSFGPLQSEWYVGMKVKLYKRITIRLEHLCIHPVVSDGSYATQARQYGGYNMLSISYGY